MPETDTGAWETNTTLEEVAAWLGSCEKIAVTTHTRPDGDALGSTLAITRALNLASEGSAQIWLYGPYSAWTKEFVGSTPVIYIDQDGIPEAEPDGVLVTDTGAWNQLEGVRDWLKDRRAKTTVMDHHLQGSGEVGDRMFIQKDAAAVCQPIAELSRLVLGLDSCSKLPVEVAEAAFLGLATDTGWFKHSNVTPAVLHLAAELIEAGVDHPKMYSMAEQRSRPARVRLLGRAIESMELVHDNRVAVMTLLRKDFNDCQGGPGDSGGFAEAPLSIGTVQVGVMITEVDIGDNPLTKASFRSKAGDNAVDVNMIAGKLGGGGHARASGAKMKCDMAEAKKRVIEALA